MSVDRLEAWAIKRWDSPDPIERAEFVHLSSLSMVPASVLATWVAPIDPKSIIREAYEESLNHAEANSTQGPQRYALRIFRASNPRRPLGQFVWMIDEAEGGMVADGMPNDPPNATGLLQIAMRALNDTTKAAGGAWKDIYNVQKTEISALRSRVSELEGERMENFTLVEELTQRKHTRDLDHTRLLSSEARKTEALLAFKVLIPTVVGRAAKHLGLATEPADIAALDQILASLNEDQFGAILATLNNTQKIALHELLKRRDAAASKPDEKGGAANGTKPADTH